MLMAKIAIHVRDKNTEAHSKPGTGTVGLKTAKIFLSADNMYLKMISIIIANKP